MDIRTASSITQI